MADVGITYGANRRAEPLSEAEQQRLRDLTGKRTRTPQEQYDLGGLRARARSDPAGRRLLDDVAHEGLARRNQGQPTGRRSVKLSPQVEAAIAAAVDRAAETWE